MHSNVPAHMCSHKCNRSRHIRALLGLENALTAQPIPSHPEVAPPHSSSALVARGTLDLMDQSATVCVGEFLGGCNCVIVNDLG